MSEDVAALYDQGLGIRSVAVAIGCTYSPARRRLLAAGVTFRPSGGRPLEADPAADPVTEYIAGLYRCDRLSVRAIAARTGYGREFVRRRLHLARVELRGRRRTGGA